MTPDTLEGIAAEIRACTVCALARTRTQAVPGEAPSGATVVFVGEAPGADEDVKGEPFVGRAGQLLVSELYGDQGCWSGYPPHKHDSDTPPTETLLEETYYHRLNPPQGFAFQRVYTDDRSLDEACAVEDHDVVMVPRGYHPVVAPHGYDLYYLNVMAGPKRNWKFQNDPAHEWIVKH